MEIAAVRKISDSKMRALAGIQVLRSRPGPAKECREDSGRGMHEHVMSEKTQSVEMFGQESDHLAFSLSFQL